eukprot:1158599-Pelagomonas_calceolata.AAC.5
MSRCSVAGFPKCHVAAPLVSLSLSLQRRWCPSGLAALQLFSLHAHCLLPFMSHCSTAVTRASPVQVREAKTCWYKNCKGEPEQEIQELALVAASQLPGVGVADIKQCLSTDQEGESKASKVLIHAQSF